MSYFLGFLFILLSNCSFAQSPYDYERIHDPSIRYELGQFPYLFARNKVNEINSKKFKLTEINREEGTPEVVYLFISGIPTEPKIPEWYRPFDHVISYNLTAYYHKLDIKKNLHKNAHHLQQSVWRLKARFPHSKIIIFGYSAGGVTAMYALESGYFELSENLKLITMASPFNGFGFPKAIDLFRLFMGGALTADMGHGVDKVKDSFTRFSFCQHFVNTSCDKDPVACRINDLHPQLRGANTRLNIRTSARELRNMPCGNINTTFINDTNHVDIVWKVFKRTLREKI